MIATLFLAWTLAFQKESSVLYEYTMRMLKRAKYTLNETRKRLPLLENSKNNFSICSQEHIKLMNAAAILIAEAKTISYFHQDIELCTSHGISDTKIFRSKTHFTLPDGLEIGEPIEFKLSNNSQVPLVPVRKENNYDILINPKRFSDIIVDNEVWLAIIYDGQVIDE
ncbi:Uncharacterised protein [Legionella busanensis]|uniref:Uncharacterized protein n=1 Tax=Legionella busanensis TaxID=190655 RepID=A0A378JM36_9GAMM|nr:hypothetical protein [Legionella busanensis]STX51259.1 Uncharacterised protein [Legionella busanensis]